MPPVTPKRWDVLTAIDRWPSWNPDIKSMSIQGDLAEGSVFRWKAGAGTITSTIQRVEPPRLIAWTAGRSGSGPALKRARTALHAAVRSHCSKLCSRREQAGPAPSGRPTRKAPFPGPFSVGAYRDRTGDLRLAKLNQAFRSVAGSFRPLPPILSSIRVFGPLTRIGSERTEERLRPFP